MVWIRDALPLLLPLAPVALGYGGEYAQEPIGRFDPDACPDYTLYASYPQ